jgi:hypothetical protein
LPLLLPPPLLLLSSDFNRSFPRRREWPATSHRGAALLLIFSTLLQQFIAQLSLFNVLIALGTGKIYTFVPFYAACIVGKLFKD